MVHKEPPYNETRTYLHPRGFPGRKKLGVSRKLEKHRFLLSLFLTLLSQESWDCI